MTPGDLTRPIESHTAARGVKNALSTPLAFASAALGGGLVALVLWLSVAEAPLGGEPVAKIELAPIQNAADVASDGTALGMRNRLNPEDDVDYKPPQKPAEDDGKPDPLDQQFDNLASSGGQIAGSLRVAPVAGVIGGLPAARLRPRHDGGPAGGLQQLDDRKGDVRPEQIDEAGHEQPDRLLLLRHASLWL